MKPNLLLPLAALLSVVCIAQAQPALGPGPMHIPYPAVSRIDVGAEAAATTLREGMDKLLEFLGQEKMPNRLQVAAFLDGTIAPYFDFDYMAKWVAGPRYAAMSTEQREALRASLEARFLGTLANKLVKYEGQRVRYFRPRRGARGAVNVAVGILQPGSYPAKLDFRMYRSKDGWKIYDIVANGRSAVAFYRQESRRSRSPIPRGAPPYGG
jgi:phospholipid transport system substrate-binding protein